ncbi:DUF4221 family protein [Algoriphagus halophilus]|uniref:TolB-like 6-blade propeller-like n=1 Tax=Algoriphagus halophilus TaxID=226505 RepID=A0A1N6GFI9_9BACT|nr:DUF4221 family protein [Algoriphagus halophilus]SIO06172.1 protein of unknown function [Algoriphagus halophilus]
MKQLNILFLVSILISCSAKEEESTSENILEDLRFSIDTVMIDSGEDILNLSQGIFPNGLSHDMSRLYFFENKPFQLVEVDLDKLKVLKKTGFEVEGPNGVGSYLSHLKVGPKDNLFLISSSIAGIFNQDAEKLENLRFTPSGIDSTLATNFNALYSRSVYDFENQKLYSQPSFLDVGDNVLVIINTKTQSAITLPVPKMKIVDEYSGTYMFETDQGEIIAFHFVGSFITLLPKVVIISTAARSGIYSLDLTTEQLEYIDIQHHTVPNEIKVEIPQNPSSPAQIQNIQHEIFKNVNFLEMQWDDTRQLYFRLGESTVRGASREDPLSYEYYLFAYDQDFNVLGEKKLDGVNFGLMHVFFKDGKLWSYVNVGDELGFAVFTFNF